MDWCVCFLVECFVCIVGKHELGGGTAARLGENQVGGISIGNEDHVTSLLLDDAIGVYGELVKGA